MIQLARRRVESSLGIGSIAWVSAFGAEKRRVDKSGLSRRELARRLRTSVPQLYRLLDTTNERKSINQLICLLQVLDCSVDLVVTDREAQV